MPKVGNRSFTYDSKGYKDAAKFAKDTGQRLVMKKGGKAKKMKKGGKVTKKQEEI